MGYTTGRELHPALKIVIQLRTIIISDIISVNKKFFSRLSKYNNLQAGKHRLFLNILLFGKLPFPILISFVGIHPFFLPVPPVSFLYAFFSDIANYSQRPCVIPPILCYIFIIQRTIRSVNQFRRAFLLFYAT